MALALGYKFDPMRGPLNAVWHKGTENRTHDWFERYFNDLNAMHEAEKVLIGEQEAEYADSLCGNGSVFATAAQRAEAFLRTLNLWTD